MNLHEEIAKVAYFLYEKSGYIDGRDVENWLEAEKIVLTRHASQDIEEPEGEEPIVTEEERVEEVEETAPAYPGKKEVEDITIIEEIPSVGKEEDVAAKLGKQAAAKSRKVFPKQTGQKIREKYH